jgi:hypothetical protein
MKKQISIIQVGYHNTDFEELVIRVCDYVFKHANWLVGTNIISHEWTDYGQVVASNGDYVVAVKDHMITVIESDRINDPNRDSYVVARAITSELREDIYVSGMTIQNKMVNFG